MLTLIAALIVQGPMAGSVPGASVRVDSVHHTVVVSAGAWDLPAGDGMSGDHMDHMAVPAQRFTWPVTGWVRGVHLVLRDANATAVPHGIVHHVEVVNLARRQLAFPAAERLAAFGKETGDVRLPASVGVPMAAGMPMAVTAAWHNDTPTTFRGVTIELVFDWLPANETPAPVSVFPVTLVVSPAIFRESAYDLPPGAAAFHRDFAWPLGGRVLALGGHLHDYAQHTALIDVTIPARPHQVAEIRARTDAHGRILSVGRLYPGIAGAGIRLWAGHTYRLASAYDNPTGTTVAGGAMTHLVLLFAPEHPDRWPRVDPDDSLWRLDLHGLFDEPMESMPGMDPGPGH